MVWCFRTAVHAIRAREASFPSGGKASPKAMFAVIDRWIFGDPCDENCDSAWHETRHEHVRLKTNLLERKHHKVKKRHSLQRIGQATHSCRDTYSWISRVFYSPEGMNNPWGRSPGNHTLEWCPTPARKRLDSSDKEENTRSFSSRLILFLSSDDLVFPKGSGPAWVGPQGVFIATSTHSVSFDYGEVRQWTVVLVRMEQSLVSLGSRVRFCPVSQCSIFLFLDGFRFIYWLSLGHSVKTRNAMYELGFRPGPRPCGPYSAWIMKRISIAQVIDLCFWACVLLGEQCQTGELNKTEFSQSRDIPGEPLRAVCLYF